MLIELEFRGIDDFNRPVFKSTNMDRVSYYGSTEVLYRDMGLDSISKIVKYFQDDDSSLVYFGGKFNCEPTGGRLEEWEFKIVDYEKR